MTCPNCQAEIPEGIAMCSLCGYRAGSKRSFWRLGCLAMAGLGCAGLGTCTLVVIGPELAKPSEYSGLNWVFVVGLGVIPLLIAAGAISMAVWYWRRTR